MTEIPPEIAGFFQEPPLTRWVVVQSPPGSDATLFVLRWAGEIGAGAYLGVNYVNVRTPWEKLRRRYPSLRAFFPPHWSRYGWLALPPCRKVPRDGLERLLEWVRWGGEGAGEFERSASEIEGDVAGEPGDQQEVGGTWRLPRRVPPPEGLDEPILPEFERLWDFVERWQSRPALIVIDSIDALGEHYGIEPSRLVHAMRKDLVDPGHANVISVFEGRERPPWFHQADGLLCFMPIPPVGRGPRWGLTIEYLEGRGVSGEKFVLALENGRLVSSPSDGEIVDSLLGNPTPTWHRGLPRDMVAFFRGPPGNMSFD